MKKYLILLGLASAMLLYAQINTGGSGGGGAATWGAITGTLADQTDLGTALGLLAPKASPTFTGTVVLPNSQALVTPVLGTPTSVTLTNATGLPESGVTNLTSDLALKSPLASPTFTGTVTLPASQALVTPVLGTPTSGVATNLTGLPLTTGVTGVLPVANGGTGSASGGLGTVFQAFCVGTVATGNGANGGTFPTSITSACTGTQSQSVGIPIPVACTAKNLYVKVGTAGSAAGSGVVTLIAGGSPSALTCTVGTGTTCNDTTHTVSLAAGDLTAIQVTTGQASDALANVRVSYQCQ